MAILVGRERRPYWWGGNGGHIGRAGTAVTLVGLNRIQRSRHRLWCGCMSEFTAFPDPYNLVIL